MKKYFILSTLLLMFTLLYTNTSAQSISNIQYTNPLCFGESSGNSNTIISQTSPPTYLEVKLYFQNPSTGFWANIGNSYGANFSYPFLNLTSGQYRIQIIDTISPSIVIEEQTFTLIDPSVFISNINTISPIQCNGGVGDLSVSTTGGTNPISAYLWSDGSNGISASVVSGIWSCSVEDSNGCVSIDSILLTEPAILEASGFVSQYILGFGNSNGEITAQVTGGTPPYNYSIDNGTLSTNNLFQNLSSSTYLLEYVDSNSCSISENILLNDGVMLNGYASILSPVTCNGYCDGSIQLVNNNSENPPYTFSLNGGPSQSSNIFDSLCGDSVYYISLFDSQNGFLVDTIYLSQPDPLLFSPSSSFACNGDLGSISLSNPTGGNGAPISYSFDGGNTFIQSWNQSSLQAGTYFLAVKDALGCITYDTTVLIEPDSINISSQVIDVSCNSLSDGSINITAIGGVPPFSYLWNDGQISQQAIGLSADTFSCSLTDSNGCSANSSIIIVSEPNILSATTSITNNLIPFSNLASINTTISGGSGNYITSWNGSNNFFSSDSNIDSLFSGIYYLNIQDSNSCVFQDTFDIIDPIAIFGCIDLLAINYNSSANIDNGMCYYCDLNYNLYFYMPSSPILCDGWISVYVPLGSYPIDYYWSNGGSSWSITGLCNDTFSVTIIDDNLCGADTSILLSNFVGCADSTMYNYDPLVLFNDSSCIPYAFGCTDPTAFNYDSIANTDNDSCEVYVYGCNDISAANYNPFVNTNDGSCWYCVYGCMDSSFFNFDLTATCNATCISFSFGCIDSLAINFDSLANTSDGSCIAYLAGCTDIIAINFNFNANIDDGSCCYIEGCTDSTMFNYSSLACIEDSSCVPFTSGCTDSLSFNYDPMANINDTSCYQCSFSHPSWLIDTTYINTCGAYAGVNNLVSINSSLLNYTWSTIYGSYPAIVSQPFLGDLCLGIYSLSVTDNIGCVFSDTIMIGNVILGCTDSTASNYDPLANVDNFSCCAAPIVDLTVGNWNFIFDWSCPGSDTTYYINFDSNGTWSNSYSGLWQLCGDQYTHSYFNDQTVYTGTYNNGVISGTMSDGISSNIGCFSIYLDSSSVIFGCTDQSAFNYEPLATLDDGSCILSIYGCTNPLACNYDLSVNVDDNSCVFIYGCMDQSAVNYDSLSCLDDGSCIFPQSNCSFQSPNGLYVSELINDRVRINWDNMNDTICMVNQYRIRYREVGTSSWSTKTMSGSGQCIFGLNTNSKVLLGLTPLTTYEYRMKAWYCGGGVSGWTSDQNFTTLDLCLNVDDFYASTPTTTKATFTWNLPATAYSFARIKLRVDTLGSTWTTAGGFGVLYPTSIKNKNNLLPGITYRASVRTWCDSTGGPYRSAAWTAPIFWTQPTSIKLAGGIVIDNLSIYPNPSRDVFNISFTSDAKQDLRVKILNLVGEELISDNLEQFTGEYTKQINLSDKAKGIYFLEVETNDGIINKKLVLQ